MLIENKIVYEIYRENFANEVLQKCAILEKNLLMLGHDRDYVNESCQVFIAASEISFRKNIIKEGIAGDALGAVAGFLLPGLGDYFKKVLIQYIFTKLNIDPRSKIASFFVDVLKNIKYSELYNYFKSGRCPYIVETLTRTVMDQFIDYVKKELIVGAIRSESEVPPEYRVNQNPPVFDEKKFGRAVEPEGPGTGIYTGKKYAKPGEAGSYDSLENEEPTFLQKQGMKLAASQAGGGAQKILKFFEDAEGGPQHAKIIEEIIRANIKQYLLPNLTRQLSKIICDDLDYKELADLTKSNVTQEKEKKVKRYS